jgi:hypothetical protein
MLKIGAVRNCFYSSYVWGADDPFSGDQDLSLSGEEFSTRGDAISTGNEEIADPGGAFAE